MRTAALALLAAFGDQERALAALPFTDDAARRWLEYRPRRRPGVSLTQLDKTARKAAHRLLATGLSEHAYAQAMAVIALEEVEGGEYMDPEFVKRHERKATPVSLKEGSKENLQLTLITGEGAGVAEAQ